MSVGDLLPGFELKDLMMGVSACRDPPPGQRLLPPATHRSVWHGNEENHESLRGCAPSRKSWPRTTHSKSSCPTRTSRQRKQKSLRQIARRRPLLPVPERTKSCGSWQNALDRPKRGAGATRGQPIHGRPHIRRDAEQGANAQAAPCDTNLRSVAPLGQLSKELAPALAYIVPSSTHAREAGRPECNTTTTKGDTGRINISNLAIEAKKQTERTNRMMGQSVRLAWVIHLKAKCDPLSSRHA